MPLLSSVRRLRAASILPLLALAAACDGDPSGIDPADRPVALAAGKAHTCALTGSGTAYCWGTSDRGELGDGTWTSSAAPVRVDAPERLTAISASWSQTCAAGASGAVYCWGDIVHIQRGGEFTASSTPSRVESALRFTRVSVGLSHACALTGSGRAYCWGYDNHLALGDGAGGPFHAATPVAVVTDARFASIVTTGLNSCGLADTGAAYCWGDASFRVFGDGSRPFELLPVATGGGMRFTSFDASATWACGVSGGGVHCWGLNRAGELGRTPLSAVPDPQPRAVAGLPDVETVFTARQNSIIGHVCALTAAGEAFCWGQNRSGEAGIEPAAAPSQLCASAFETTCVPTPVRAAPALRFRTLALGQTHTCGITREHEIHCWGRAAEGQLGPDPAAGGAAPVRVELPES
jgi:alpha-tubulin suppressor-like RCC1 family protein